MEEIKDKIAKKPSAKKVEAKTSTKKVTPKKEKVDIVQQNEKVLDPKYVELKNNFENEIKALQIKNENNSKFVSRSEVYVYELILAIIFTLGFGAFIGLGLFINPLYFIGAPICVLIVIEIVLSPIQKLIRKCCIKNTAKKINEIENAIKALEK